MTAREPTMPGEKPSTDAGARYSYRRSVRKTDDTFASRLAFVNKYVNRPLASLIVRAVFQTRITPNHLTVASFAISLAAAYGFSRGGHWWFAAGGLLAQLSSTVDCADGQLARARNETSEFGAYLDLILDRVGEFLLLAGIAIGCHRVSAQVEVLLVGLWTVGVYFLFMTVFYLIQQFREDAQTGENAEMRSWLLALMLLAGVLNRMVLALQIVLVFSVVGTAYLVAAFCLKRDPARPGVRS